MTQNIQPGPVPERGSWPPPPPWANQPSPPVNSPTQQRASVPSQYVAPQAPVTRPYTQGKRWFYGLMWTCWTVIFGIGGLAALSSSPLAGLLGLGIGALAGRYAYRIWTWQAKSLWFFVVF